jgi:hypothetical protein
MLSENNLPMNSPQSARVTKITNELDAKIKTTNKFTAEIIKREANRILARLKIISKLFFRRSSGKINLFVIHEALF